LKTALFHLLLLGAISSITACNSVQKNPAVLTFSKIFTHDAHVEPSNLDPRFHYLRVTLNGRIVILASATSNIDIPDTTSVWYSAEREALRFQNGRLLGAVGLATEWRAVNIPALPKWSELAQNTQPFKWTRIRDAMPGYRYNLSDELILQRISIPADTQLKAIDPRSLIWFEERFAEDASESNLPPSRYAVDISAGNERVLYGEQCVSKELCFSWQQWPVVAKDKQ
jgi:hypothetical protein